MEAFSCPFCSTRKGILEANRLRDSLSIDGILLAV